MPGGRDVGVVGEAEVPCTLPTRRAPPTPPAVPLAPRAAPGPVAAAVCPGAAMGTPVRLTTRFGPAARGATLRRGGLRGAAPRRRGDGRGDR